jgi:uncharacterized UPF0160 family protein
MKDLKTIRKGITHSGKFHTDDVISTAFLKFFNPNMEVIRVNEYQGQPKDDEIIYDIGLGEFDHHQEVRRMDSNNHPYSAFGLLWETYGREYLQDNGFRNIEKAFLLFKQKYVFKIDQGDNEGYREVKTFFENDLIIKCNPLWFEENVSEDEQFDKAVSMGKAFLDSWTRDTFYKTEETNYVD